MASLAPAVNAARAPARRWPSWLPAVLLFALLALVHPIVYVGGGADDWHYLQAARCAAAHGPCLPLTHWAARFPLVAPAGLALRLFGETAFAVALVPALYAVAALILLARNVERRFGRVPAMLAGAMLVVTPAFTMRALTLNVDVPELAWMLAALLAAQVAIERGAARVMALAGATLALAMLTRASAIVLLPIAALLWLGVPRARRLPLGLGFAAGLGGVLAADAAGYWLATGDPAHGWLLSLHHTRIPTTDLPPGVDLTRSALFNLELIRSWKRSMGIEVHWTIDPMLNLLANPESGLTLIGAGVLALMGRAGWTGERRRWLGLAVLAAAAHFLLLCFVLAVNPTSRMFLPEVAVAAAIIGVLGAAAWRAGRARLVLAALLVLATMRTVIVLTDAVDVQAAAAAARDWAAARPGLSVDDWTRRTLTLEPAIRALPLAGGRGTVLALSRDRCAIAAARRGAGWAVLRERRFAAADPAPIAWLRARAILFRAREVPTLCLLQRGD